MKALLKKMIFALMRLIPLRKIVFESRPDLSDNTKAVFDEMVQRGLNNKYKFVWICRGDSTQYPEIKNVKYKKRKGSKWGYYSLILYLLSAKCCICCNSYTLSKNPNTCNVYLDHGNPLKDTGKYYPISKEFDMVNNSSEAMKDIKKRLFNLDEKNMVVAGYPRNDVFAKPRIDLHPFFDTDFEKIIVWYPTVRQFAGHHENLCDSSHALPVVWDEQRAIALNNYAKQKKVLIVLKPHFAQDVTKFKKLNMTNLVFIDEMFLKEHALSSYEFLNACDALLTDYSSVYYDYLLCDRPIGLIWEDFEEYSRNPGFCVDMDELMKGGEKIYTFEELKQFVEDVSEEKDRLQAQRRENRDTVNYATDGQNTKRVTDEIMRRIAQ